MACRGVRTALLVSGTAAVLCVACGDNTAHLSPVAPTATESTASLIVAQTDSSNALDHQRDGRFRELSGTVTAKAADSLTVRDTVVKVEHATLIRHGHRILTLADIEIGDRVEIRGVANGTTFTASEIKLEGRGHDDNDDEGDDDEDDDSNKAEVKGLISGLTGTCPTLTFTVGTTRVSTTTTTDFRGTACSAIVNGAHVDVQGTSQAGDSIVATKVDTKLGEHEIRGLVSLLTGLCPNLTFTVGTTRVAANPHTEFKGKGCEAILNGVTVEAKGTLQSDGSIVATKVDVGVGHDEHEVKGIVSGLSGTCPSLTFMVGSTRVTTSLATEFKDAVCTAITNDARVEAEGMRLIDGTIAASQVEVDDDDREDEDD